MVKKKGMHIPKDKWVRRIVKLITDAFGFEQVPMTGKIKLTHNNPPCKFWEGEKQKDKVSITLPNTPNGGSQAYVAKIRKWLIEGGFDLETYAKEHEELSIIRLETGKNRGLRNVSTITNSLLELAETINGKINCWIDPGYKEYLNYLCESKGMTQGEIIEEALDVYERNQ
jgi:hypothetical protein